MNNLNDKLIIIHNDEIDLKALWMVLWTNKKSLLKIAGGFVLPMIVYLIFVTPLYYSNSTTFQTSGEVASSLDKLSGLAAGVGLDVGAADVPTEFVDLIDYVLSRRLKDGLIVQKWPTKEKEIDLVSLWEINDTTGILYSLKSLIISDKITKEERELKWAYDAMIKLEERIIARYTDTGLFIVEVWMEDPLLAQTMAKFIVNSIVNYSNEVKADKWRKTREFTYSRMKDVNIELEQAEDILIKFQKENRRIIDSPDMMVELASLTRDVQIKTTIYITLLNEYEFARIEESKDMAAIIILDDAQYPVEPNKPDKPLLLILSILGGSILSVPSFLFFRAFQKGLN